MQRWVVEIQVPVYIPHWVENYSFILSELYAVFKNISLGLKTKHVQKKRINTN